MDALTSQLQARGLLQGPLDLSDQIGVHALLHVLTEALQSAQKQREGAAERLRDQGYELERAHTSAEGALRRAAAAERDAEQERAKARRVWLAKNNGDWDELTTRSAAQKAQTADKEALKTLREDLQKARGALKDVKIQAQHDSKRRERDVASTLQKWQRLASAPAVVSNGRLTLRAPLPAPTTPSDASRGELQLLEDSLTDLEASRTALLSENAELRETMRFLDEELRALLSSADKSPAGVSENFANLPASLLQQQVTSLLALLVENINDRLDAYTVHQAHVEDANAAANKAENASAEWQAKHAELTAELESANERAREAQLAKDILQARFDAHIAESAAARAAAAPLAAATVVQHREKRPAPADEEIEAERAAHKELKRARRAARAEAQAAEERVVGEQTPPPLVAPTARHHRKHPSSTSALAGILALTASPANVPRAKDRHRKTRT